MAIIYQATLVPSKAEIVAAWLPTQPWFDGPADVAVPVAAYRFDDPAGEVGAESLLLDVHGRLVHVPLTYRSAALPGAEQWLLGTLEHSVLGTRWVYDAQGDPVYRAELTRVVQEGDTQVRMLVETPDGPVEREPSIHVRGSGTGGPDATRPDGPRGPEDVAVVRFPTPDVEVPSTGALVGTLVGQDAEMLLAYLV
jgi:hypothetical protein